MIEVPSSRRHRMCDAVYFLIVTLHCAWVLSLPLFPSQDGPHHLYLVDIFRKLLFHSSPLYDRTYFIGRYLPPYSTYYYSLICLASVMSLEAADKVLVCAFFLLFATGMRSLLRAVSRQAYFAQFLALPMLLSWTLMMGFVNYSLGIALACIALAFWCRRVGGDGLGWRALFLLLMLLILFTHPVAWAFAQVFLAFHLASEVLQRHRAREQIRCKNLVRDAFTALLSAAGFSYLRSFQYSTITFQTLEPEPGTYFHRLSMRLFSYIAEHGLAVFADLHDPWTVLYRVLLGVCFVSVAAVAGRALWIWTRKHMHVGSENLALVWAAFAMVFLLAEPFIPAQLNGSDFFAQRLLLPLYLSLLVAASPLLKKRLGASLAALGGVLSLFNLGLAAVRITPIAREISSYRQLPPVHTSGPGLILFHSQPATDAKVSFDPYAWAAASYFREHGVLLYNTAWLEQSHIPVKLKASAATTLDQHFHATPPQLVNGKLAWHNEVQGLPKNLSFVIGPVAAHRPTDDIRQQTSGKLPDPAFARWNCTRQNIWEICTPAR